MNQPNLPLHPSQLHPLTGEPIRALWQRPDGRLMWPIMGGAPDDPKEDPKGDPKEDPKEDPKGDPKEDPKEDPKDLGYPKDTPVSEMNAEQRASYFKDKADKEEARRKGLSKAVGGKTAEQIAADLAELEKLRAAGLTDQEKAVKDAADAARAEERTKAGTRLARAEFKAALAHVDARRRDTIIEGINLAAYIDDDGEVDTDKVTKYAESIAPVDTTKTRRDYGGGHRTERPAERGAAGKAEADRRFKKTKSNADA